MNMNSYMKNGYARFSQIKEPNTRVNLYEKCVLSSIHKNNSGSLAMSNNYVQHKQSEQPHKFRKKKDVRAYITC